MLYFFYTELRQAAITRPLHSKFKIQYLIFIKLIFQNSIKKNKKLNLEIEFFKIVLNFNICYSSKLCKFYSLKTAAHPPALTIDDRAGSFRGQLIILIVVKPCCIMLF